MQAPTAEKQDSAAARAALALGQMLLNSGDAPAAIESFRMAARSGEAMALTMLGRIHDRGWGVAPDREAGIMWLRRAAARGHATASHMVAWLDAHPSPALEGAELEAVLDRIEQKVILGALRDTAE